jgi:putative aminopeptidase FrvX
MKIKDTFIELVKTTIPHGYESLIYPLLPKHNLDAFGNAYIHIGDTKPKNLFTAHLDTFSKGEPETITHKISGDFVKTNGKSILGADDKAGVALLISMIQAEIPGLYYFFTAEEIGRYGSRFAVDSLEFNAISSRIQNVISFDRKGYNSIITHQSNIRTCDDNFALSLSSTFKDYGINMELDKTGLFTDSFSFLNHKNIKNCTNISVGYFNQHNKNEKQDVLFLEKLSKACNSISWDSIK